MPFHNDMFRIPDTKIPLRFSPDGTFRILLLSDLQCREAGDPRTLAAIDAIIEEKKPDLVLWGGDNPFGAADRESLIRLIGKFAGPMESRKIPWAVTFGNHDTAACESMTEEEIEQVYETEFPYCVTGHVDGIHGISNYLLPIRSSAGDGKIAFAVWSLDSGRGFASLGAELGMDEDICKLSRPKNEPFPRSTFDIVRFDQLVWFWQMSNAMQEQNGAAVPSIILTHTCVHETHLLRMNPEELCVEGYQTENISPGPINSGLYAAALQEGNVLGIYYGHNHNNTSEGTYCGIRLGYIGGIGFDAYGLHGNTDRERNERRACRLLTIEESNPRVYRSEILLASDYVELTDKPLG